MSKNSHAKIWLALANHWRVLGQTRAADQLEEVVALLRSRSVKSTEQFISAIKSVPATETPHKDSSLEPLVDCVAASGRLLSEYGKKATSESVNLLFTAIEPNRSMSADSFFGALRGMLHATSPNKGPSASASESGVDFYAALLQSNWGNKEEFGKSFKRLESDPEMKQPEVVQLANMIAFKMAKGTPKKVALQRIWELHEVSESAGAKVRSSDGRSAA